jgi:hypothetical protein
LFEHFLHQSIFSLTTFSLLQNQSTGSEMKPQTKDWEYVNVLQRSWLSYASGTVTDRYGAEW